MKVTDPVCGMPIDSAKAAATETVRGQTLYFCSAGCHAKYQANPDRYATKGPAAEKRRGC